MEREQKTRVYLDRLKKISSKENKKDVGILDIQNGNSHRHNESHQYIEPTFESNDLLAKVERYIKANPMSHITKNRLTIKRGFQPNLQNKNNINSVYKSYDVKNTENVISFIKPSQKVVKYKPDTKIKFGPPNATSTIEHQQTQYVSISSKPIIKPTTTGKNDPCGMNEKNYGVFPFFSNSSCSAAFTSPIKIRNDIKGVLSTTPESNTFNKNQCISIEEKAKLNLKYCLYLEFVHSNCDEIKNNEKIHVSNDYSVNLKKQLQQIKLKHQNEQSVNNTNLSSSTISSFNDKSNKYSNTTQTGSISNHSDFTFKPVLNLSISPDSRFSQYSQDSFIYPTPETLFTNTYNSINIDQNTFGLIEENFSSPEMCSNGSNKYLLSQRETSQSKCTHFANSDSSSEIFIQSDVESDTSSVDSLPTKRQKPNSSQSDTDHNKSNNTSIQESSPVSSDDSFKYYKKSMF